MPFEVKKKVPKMMIIPIVAILWIIFDRVMSAPVINDVDIKTNIKDGDISLQFLLWGHETPVTSIYTISSFISRVHLRGSKPLENTLKTNKTKILPCWRKKLKLSILGRNSRVKL